MSINEALREARKAAGYTLAAAAEQIGIKDASLSRIENGHTAVSLQRLAQFSSLYGISGAALLEGEVLMRPTSIDLLKMQQVIEMVAEIIKELEASPSPSKLAGAVAQIYAREINRLIDDPSAKFDTERHRADAETIFRD